MSSSFQNEIPKARVNLKLDLHTGGGQKKVELPLKLLVAGDFSNGQEERPLSERVKTDINKNNFNDVLADISPSVHLNVENTLAGDGSEESISLTFRNMNDFTPEQVARQIPRLKAMLAMRSLLRDLKQGHVYIISNIGSFGENVFKIGMTRRLEPMDRVKELSGASVPFDFDVHAMISCDDAPALEKTLHDSLEKYRINRINLRKEFFRVKLEKIINEVERHHGQVEYVADPAALQYLQSLECAENEAA